MSAARLAAAIARRYGARGEIPDSSWLSLLGSDPSLNLDALAALNERSVCRRYRPDPVPEALGFKPGV